MSEERITVIHNGIESESPGQPQEKRLHFRALWQVSSNDLLIGAVGRLDPVKGFRLLIEGFDLASKYNGNLRLVIMGDGPDFPVLKRAASVSGMGSRIVFAGSVPEAAAALAALDIFASSSLSECHSVALLEAMRAGLPIVASRVGGNPESLEEGKEGLLVPAGDAVALARGIEALVSSRERREAQGRAARERFLRDFTQEVMLRKTANWLLGCAEQAKQAGLFV